MHQATIVIGKSARVDVAVGVGVALGTAVPADSVGINIGNNTAKPWGIIERDILDCIEVLGEDSKIGGGLAKAQQSIVGVNGKAGISVSANNALTAETNVAVIRNSTGNLDGQTEMIQEGLLRCLQELKLKCYEDALAGVVK